MALRAALSLALISTDEVSETQRDDSGDLPTVAQAQYGSWDFESEPGEC